MTEEDRETVTRPADDVAGRDDRPKTCATCGEPIALKEWHPVVATTDDEGAFKLYAFCSEDCRQAWDADG